MLRHVARISEAQSGNDQPALTPLPDFTSFIRATKKKREAERRQAQYFMMPCQRARQRAKRRALACRRPTTALAAASQRHRSAPERASWDVAKKRALPAPACPSPATKSQTGHHAGRASSRSRPGAEVTSPRPREPLSLRQPVSPAGVLYGSEIRGVVTEMETDVKWKVTISVTQLSAVMRGFDPRIHAELWHVRVLRLVRYAERQHGLPGQARQ